MREAGQQLLLPRRVDQVKALPIDWLWPGRLAAGKLTLLDGDPEIGKTWIALDLCARLSKGAIWPGGAPGLPPCTSLFLSAEDNDADTLVPRLTSLGADLSKVYLWPSEHALPRLPADLDALDGALSHTKARLVVLDPLLAFLDAQVSSAHFDSVQRLLVDLLRLAEKHHCAMLLIRHLIKRGIGRALFRGFGSLAFSSFCRLAWLVGKEPDNPQRSVLAQNKSNLGPAQSSLAYRIHFESSKPLSRANLSRANLSQVNPSNG